MNPLQIENERMLLRTDNPGAQMISLFDKKAGRELLYQADQGWSGRNPSLFPTIGKTWKNGEYEIEGKTYAMKNHGLVRYENLDGSIQDDRIVYVLDSNGETLKKYPFDFHFELIYTLLENGVRVQYVITNTGDKTMPFSFGLHPAFKTVQNADEVFEDFSISFEPKSMADQIVFFPDLSPVKRVPVILDTWKCNHEDMDQYATLVFDQIEAREATLFYKDEPRLKMSFAGFPTVALWNADRSSDFICIEPWFGHTDFEKVDGPFEKREGTLSLKPGETFNAQYTIESLA